MVDIGEKTPGRSQLRSTECKYLVVNKLACTSYSSLLSLLNQQLNKIKKTLGNLYSLPLSQATEIRQSGTIWKKPNSQESSDSRLLIKKSNIATSKG